MRNKQFVIAWALLTSAIALCGCGPMKKQAIFRASMDFNCPKEDLKAYAIHPEIYRVKGCDQEGVYECSPTTEQCVLQEHYNID